MSIELLPVGGLVLLLIKITLVLSLSLTWACMLGRASASTRYLIWLSSLALLLAIPLLSGAGPVVRVPLPFGSSEALQIGSPPSWPETPRINVHPDGAAVQISVESESAAAPPAAGFRWGEVRDRVTPVGVLLGAWAVGVLLLLGRLATSAVRLRRVLRAAVPLEEPSWTNPLWEAADRLDLADVPRLVLSEQTAMPFACGLRRPTIVLPRSSRLWDADRRRTVLFHELAHIRRRDLLGHTMARVVCALYWIHPLVWTAARRLRAESERACDDLALSVGIRPSEYADHLLQIVTAVRGKGSPAVALPFAHRRELEGRVLAILDPVLPRGRPTRAHLGALALLLLCGAGFSAVELESGEPSAPAPAPVGIESQADAWASAPNLPPRTARDALLPAPPEPPASPLPGAAPAPLPGPIAEPHAGSEAPARPGGDLMTALTWGIQTVVETSMEAAAAAVGKVFRDHAGLQKEHLPAILKLLSDDPSPGVRKAAAWSLAVPDSAVAVRALTHSLLNDPDAGVRETAAWALHGAADRDVILALTQAVARDAAPEVRATAAWALGNSGPRASGALPTLTRALRDPSSAVRERAVWGIGSIKPAQAPSELYRLSLADPEVRVRSLASWALGEIRDPRAADALRTRLTVEERPEVTRAVLRAILLTSGPSQDLIAVLLASSDPFLRERGIELSAGGSSTQWPWPWPWPDVRITP